MRRRGREKHNSSDGAAIQVGAAELDFYGRPRMPLSFGLGKCYLAPEAVLQMDRDALITQP